MITNKIFGNELSPSVLNAAEKARNKSIIKYGTDAGQVLHYSIEQHPVLEEYGARVLIPAGKDEPFDYNLVAKPLIVGNIGGQSIRSSLAICSAARALGRMALWLDIGAYPNTASAKLIAGIRANDEKYGQLAQSSALFQKLYWEKGYVKKQRSLKQNLMDRAMCTMFAPLFQDFKKDTPFVATHAFAAHSAAEAGMQYIVNALPGNCPFGTHLSEGSIHTAQTPYSYIGYKMLRGMNGNHLSESIPDSELVYAGRFVEHLMIQHLERDCEKRMMRAKGRLALRWLISLDDLFLKKELLLPIFTKLLELEKDNRAILIINIGKHTQLWEALKTDLPDLRMWAVEYEPDDYISVKNFAQELRQKRDVSGIHVFSSTDEILAAHTTNVMLRGSDILLARPCEISLYPIPKLIARRRSREEFWNSMHAEELGEATFECYSTAQLLQMIDVLDRDRDVIELMCKCIQKNASGGLYSGAYEAVRLATEQH